MNVFELNATIKAVQEKDLDPETLKDTLESLELPRNEKLDNVATWIENNQMKLQWLKEKKRQLSDTETAIKSQTNRLQDDTGQKEIQTENHILRPRNYKDAVVVEDTKKLPIDYIMTSEVVKPNKKLLYEDLKKGKSITGAHLKANRKTVIK